MIPFDDEIDGFPTPAPKPGTRAARFVREAARAALCGAFLHGAAIAQDSRENRPAEGATAATRPAADPAAALKRGQTALREERFEDALADFEAARAANPRSIDATIFCGEALFLLERFPAAIDRYEAAVSMDPGVAASVYNHGAALLKLRRPAEAKARFEIVAAKAPRPDARARGVFGVGAALSDLGDDAGAEASFVAALKLDPTLLRAKYRLGVLRLRAGDAAAAVQAISEVIAADPFYDGAAYNLALAHAALKNDAEAVRYRGEFRRLRDLKNRIDGCKLRLRTEPSDTDLVLTIARGYAEAPAWRDAARWFGRATALPGFPAGAWLEYAEALERTGDARGAAAARARATTPPPR